MNKTEQLREALIELIKRLLAEEKPSQLHQAALRYIGTDASPRDIAPDELGCAESVSEIINDVLPNFPIITGTWTLWDVLERAPRFYPVTKPEPGDIVISPTGKSRKGSKAPFVGHVGIVGKNKTIMSNDSFTGKWMSNYTVKKWRERWEEQGGYPVLFYRMK